MKSIALLLSLFFISKSLAVAPYGFRGQSQSSVQYSNVLQFPQSQVTKLSGINSLAETGNLNALVNPGFEGSPINSGWSLTQSAGTFAASTNTTVFESGVRATTLTATSGAGTFFQSITVNAANLDGRVDGYFRVWVSASSGADFEVCSYVNATAANCKTIVANTKAVYEGSFTFGTTSYGIIVRTRSTHTGNVTIDNAYAGINPGNIQASLSSFLRAPGTATPRSCYYQMGGSGSLTSQTNCTSSPCTEYVDTCGTLSNSRGSTGTYTITGASGTCANNSRIHCTAYGSNGANGIRNETGAMDLFTSASGGFTHTFSTYISGGALTDTRSTIKCECEGP